MFYRMDTKTIPESMTEEELLKELYQKFILTKGKQTGGLVLNWKTQHIYDLVKRDYISNEEKLKGLKYILTIITKERFLQYIYPRIWDIKLYDLNKEITRGESIIPVWKKEYINRSTFEKVWIEWFKRLWIINNKQNEDTKNTTNKRD